MTSSNARRTYAVAIPVTLAVAGVVICISIALIAIGAIDGLAHAPHLAENAYHAFATRAVVACLLVLGTGALIILGAKQLKSGDAGLAALLSFLGLFLVLLAWLLNTTNVHASTCSDTPPCGLTAGATAQWARAGYALGGLSVLCLGLVVAAIVKSLAAGREQEDVEYPGRW